MAWLYFFALLGSSRIKAAKQNVGEIDPWFTVSEKSQIFS
jgi:hypothetical protein